MRLFLKEILEQPKALREVLERYSGEARDNLKVIKKEFDEGEYENILLTGIGSSYFASSIASNILNENGVTSFTCEAGELFYHNLNGLDKKNLIIAISQSGESIEVRKVVKLLNTKCTVIGITNNKNSFLSRNVNFPLLIYAGQEKMTATKTYANTIVVLLLLGFSLADDLTDKWKVELSKIPNLMEKFMENWEKKVGPIIDFLGEVSFLNLISRGPSLSSALQASLILEEASHIPTQGLSGNSFRHGPFEIVGKGHKVIVFSPVGKTSKLNINMAREMAQLGSKVLLISNEDVNFSHKNLHFLKLPKMNEYFFPLLDVIPIQFLALKLGEKKGIESGSFQRGSKVTTRE